MNLNGTKDLRVQKTITEIKQDFEELILTTNYEKITVAELARRARINKKTLYRYCPTKDDLLAELQTSLSQDYLALTKDLVYPRDLAKSITYFFNFSAK